MRRKPPLPQGGRGQALGLFRPHQKSGPGSAGWLDLVALTPQMGASAQLKSSTSDFAAPPGARAEECISSPREPRAKARGCSRCPSRAYSSRMYICHSVWPDATTTSSSR
eukprot:scaffold19854_cov64-Phaeocystis_antarctica.AAC.3